MDLVTQGTQANQQVQAAAMAESNQLESLPLSALSADDNGPPQVTYGSEQPLAASTPRATSTSIPEMQTTDTYHWIIPGMSNHLYPTLVAEGSLSAHIADNHGTLQNMGIFCINWIFPLTDSIIKTNSEGRCTDRNCLLYI